MSQASLACRVGIAGIVALFAGASPLSGAVDVIVDNSDPEFSVLQGTWTLTSASTVGKYGNDYRYATTVSSATGSVQWQPNLSTAGDYRVYVWYPAGGIRTNDAQYTVYHSGGSQTFSVDQTVNAGQWVQLGSFTFAAGSSTNGRVVLTNQSTQTSKRVYADAVRFYLPDPVTLTMVVSPVDSGSTTPAEGGPYNYLPDDVVNLAATPAPGYVFGEWQVSAGSPVADPNLPETTVTMDVSKTVTAVFVPLELTMAVSPPGAGTTDPAVGGPYPKNFNEVVSISATANAGYVFDHWTVSAGSGAAEPNSANTTVTMDTGKTVTAVFVPSTDLTMAVSPPGAGTTDPAIGGPYTGAINRVVSIAASANPGYVFDHWVVTAGSGAANPTYSNTTVTMEVSKTVTAVFVEALTLHMAVSPPGAGTTSPPVGGPYVKGFNEAVTLLATAGPGYVFDHWTVSDGAEVANPTWAYTTVTMDVPKIVTAVFVALPPANLTMAVSPVGAGTTGPAVGGPYSYLQGEVVNISAAANSGYRFSNWAVSDGAATANPYSINTTVKMDASKTVTAVFVPTGTEFRAFWASVWGEGYRNATEVNNMIARAVAGGYNAIIPQVLAYYDNPSAAHGAYWRSDIVPRSSYVTANFDPLGYMCQQAHAAGIQVHPWLVAFRVASTDIGGWPPVGNSYLAARPHWLRVPRGSIDTVAPTSPTDGAYELDPGSPEVQDYLASIVQELVTDYQIDGIHWDYIRYTQLDSGYPSDVDYEYSTLKRFQRLTGRTDVPATSGDPQWDDFRRRTVTEVVRRMRWEIPLITSNPRQPVRYSASLVTWSPVYMDFHSNRPYTQALCDWESWMDLGYLDSAIPMNYYSGGLVSDYRSWTDYSCQLYRHNRHMIIGPNIGMNSFAESVSQLLYARGAGADGLSTYSYTATNDTGATWYEWYPYVAANAFTVPAAIPSMPWRDAATAGEGTLYGVVTNGGLPVDGAVVQIGSVAVPVDANGYYVISQIPASASDSTCTVSATKGLLAAARHNVPVVAGGVLRQDIAFGGPTITQEPGPQNVCPGAAAVFTVGATGTGTLTYQWQKNNVNLGEGGHYSGSFSDTLTVSNADAGDVADYRCVVTDSIGTKTSSAASLSLKTPTEITQHPSPQDIAAGETAMFTVAGAGEGTVTYQWQKNNGDLSDGGHYSGVTTPTLTVSNADSGDEGAYRCVVTAGCGSVNSNEAMLTVATHAQADLDGDSDVDLADFSILQSCFNGPNRAPKDGCGVDADFDQDQDVDLTDFSTFQGCFNGPNRPPKDGCP